MKKILKNTIILILIIILIYILYLKLIAKKNIITFGGYGCLIVLSGSMEPEIEKGEFVLIKKEENYQVGDIITYQIEDYLVTHRIIRMNENNIITKGDANNEEEFNRKDMEIIGKVKFHSKAIGIFITYYLKAILIMFVLLGGIITIFLNKIKIKENNNEKNKGI